MIVYTIATQEGVKPEPYKGRDVHRSLADARAHAELYPGARVIAFDTAWILETPSKQDIDALQAHVGAL